MTNRSLINKYNVAVPRYTSYPPATFFSPFANGPEEAMKLIQASNTQGPAHMSFYLHIPYCPKICYYCGCNAFKLNRDSDVSGYVDALKKEIVNTGRFLDKSRKVTQIHYGGGTPNAIDVEWLLQLNRLITANFNVAPNAEIAIECNPAYLNEAYLNGLLEAGFNRISLGIQDFDENVLKTSNREKPAMPVQEIITYLRDRNPAMGINLDFIFGLPGQSVEKFTETMRKAIDLKPDRLVTFSYAHVPWVKKHQLVLEKAGLPSQDEKTDMFFASRDILSRAGYIPIGLDHYVLPGDELDQAIRKNELHRNFQGYCTRNTTGQVYAFGVTAITQLEQAYLQNAKSIDAYINRVNEYGNAVIGGYVLQEHERITREVITMLMCNKFVSLETIARRFQLPVSRIREAIRFDRGRLSELADDGLIRFDDDSVTVLEEGAFFIRNIAAALDNAYQPVSTAYSKNI